MADKVLINGTEYVPRETVITKLSLERLRGAYSIAWSNSYYDPYHDCDAVKKLKEVTDLLQLVNKELHFKE